VISLVDNRTHVHPLTKSASPYGNACA